MASKIVMDPETKQRVDTCEDLGIDLPSGEGQTLAARASSSGTRISSSCRTRVRPTVRRCSGASWASRETALTWRTLVWSCSPFTCARFVALGSTASRTASWTHGNPRHPGAELRRTAQAAQAWVAVVLAAAVFLATAWALNPLCFAARARRPRVHFGLQLCQAVHALVPPVARSGRRDRDAGGYLAVTGRWSEPWWLLPVGALAVTFWWAGSDVFYALQDEDFDRSERSSHWWCGWGRRGDPGGQALHGLALIALVLFGVGAGWGRIYVGVAVSSALIAWSISS